MKKRYYPYIYGGIAGVMTFIAMFYICRHSFALTNIQSLVWGIIGAILCLHAGEYGWLFATARPLPDRS